MHCDSDSESKTTPDQSGLKLSNLVQKRTGHVPIILWERLGVTGTMVLLQHFKSKVYKNGHNTLTVACNASRSHVILVHTKHFTLEQMQDDLCDQTVGDTVITLPQTSVIKYSLLHVVKYTIFTVAVSHGKRGVMITLWTGDKQANNTLDRRYTILTLQRQWLGA